MINYLSGKIIKKKDKFILIDIGRIGYRVFLSQKSLLNLKEGQEADIFCFLDVRETSLNLYGFLDYQELELFEILDSIRGVGPKAALEISSLGPLEKIKERVLSHDEKLFEGIPGIGRKKAMAIIVELSGKISSLDKFSKEKIPDEAEDTLISLGFSREQAKEALKSASKDIKNEDRIKQALKILGQGQG